MWIKAAEQLIEQSPRIGGKKKTSMANSNGYLGLGF